jgi:hypothetical protein
MSDGDILGNLSKFCRHRNWENVHSVLGKYSKNSLGEAALLRLQKQPKKITDIMYTSHH